MGLVLKNDRGKNWRFGKLVTPHFAFSLLCTETLQDFFNDCSESCLEFEIQLVVEKKNELR